MAFVRQGRHDREQPMPAARLLPIPILLHRAGCDLLLELGGGGGGRLVGGVGPQEEIGRRSQHHGRQHHQQLRTGLRFFALNVDISHAKKD